MSICVIVRVVLDDPLPFTKYTFTYRIDPGAINVLKLGIEVKMRLLSRDGLSACISTNVFFEPHLFSTSLALTILLRYIASVGFV